MNFNRLKHIRQQLYESLERGADALFNLADALLSESQAQSLPELSLSPFFERQWPSVYEALEDGRINVEQVRALWVKILLAERAEHEPIWIAVDGSNLARPSAPTSGGSDDHPPAESAPGRQTDQCRLDVFDGGVGARANEQLDAHSGSTAHQQ